MDIQASVAAISELFIENPEIATEIIQTFMNLKKEPMEKIIESIVAQNKELQIKI